MTNSSNVTTMVLENMLFTITDIQALLHKEVKRGRTNMMDLLQDLGEDTVEKYMNGLQDVTRHLQRSKHPLCLKLASTLEANLHLVRCASAGLEVQRILCRKTCQARSLTPETAAAVKGLVHELDQQLERLYSDFGFVPSHQVVPTLYDTNKLRSIDVLVQEHGAVSF
jgi:hypothetical protein